MFAGLKNTGNSVLKIDSVRIIQDPLNPVFQMYENMNGFEIKPDSEKEITIYYTPTYKNTIDRATLQFLSKT